MLFIDIFDPIILWLAIMSGLNQKKLPSGKRMSGELVACFERELVHAGLSFSYHHYMLHPLSRYVV